MDIQRTDEIFAKLDKLYQELIEGTDPADANEMTVEVRWFKDDREVEIGPMWKSYKRQP